MFGNPSNNQAHIETPRQILIVDDDRAVCQSLHLLFSRAGYAVHVVHKPAEVLPLLARQSIDIALFDLNFTIETSGKQGLQLLHQVRRAHPELPIILMTGWATVQLAVQGMKAGACDFVAKPWDNKTLLASVKDTLALRTTPASGPSPSAAFDPIITQSPALLQLLESARRVAATDAPVLITGESGTGKELVAEAIHAASARAAGPFVAVNLGGIPESLFESELFGHAAGAFTDAKADRKGRFEYAQGGTLFLDEIADLLLPSQVKLLRVLQERRYQRLGESQNRTTDVRIISATNKPLEQLVQQGVFREDLLYRINLIHLHLPPLRERPGDIAHLADHFLRQAAQRYGRATIALAPSARQWLVRQPFPGNVRQLRNLIERVLILHPEDVVTDAALQTFSSESTAQSTTLEGRQLAEVEESMVRSAMLRHGGNVTHAAMELGLTRAALYRRLDKYGINPDVR